MSPRIASCLVTLFAAAAIASPASAAQVVPLSGKGENIEGVARVQMAGATEVELAGDWAFVALDKTEEGVGGLAIVNIANPQRPYVESTWRGSDAGISDISVGDVDLSPDGNLAVLTNAHCSECAEGKVPWVLLIDVSDKARPKLVGKIIDDATIDYVHTATLDNKTLYLNPQVAAFYPQPGNAHITVFDISDPSNPVKKGVIAPPGADAGLAHDSYVDHRPDKKTLMYAASVHKSDVIDITDPLNSTWLQSAVSTYTISHDVQPNYDRSVIVVDDEGALGGQLDESVSACGKAGSGPASVDSGSLHFYQAAPDGTFANGGAVQLGSFNAPTNVNTGACVAHVFWQAPNENRLTQAYYRTGAFVVDFEDPANPKMLGWFLPDGGAEYWSNKPHNGYMYATDMEHGLDILRYTGEGGTRWPATAGPAEVQRAERQGVPYVPMATSAGSTPADPPSAPADQGAAAAPDQGAVLPAGAVRGRSTGAVAFAARLARVPGRRGSQVPVTIVFRDAQGKRVGSLRVRRTAGKAARIRVAGAAVSGRYSWVALAGGRAVGKGRLRVGTGGAPLAPKRTFSARAR